MEEIPPIPQPVPIDNAAIEDFFKNLGSLPVSHEDKIKAEKERSELFDLKRNNETATLKHIIFKVAVILFSVLLGIIILIRTWHLIAPCCMTWMQPKQIDTIDTAIISGLFGGVVGKFFNQIFNLAKTNSNE